MARFFFIAVTLAIWIKPAPSEAYHCGQYWQVPPYTCIYYVPDTLPGFTVVSSSYTPVGGEFMMCTSGYDYCQKNSLGPGGSYNIGNLGDWASNGMFPMKHQKSCQARDTKMFEGLNFAGNEFDSRWNCASWNDTPSGQAKSMSLQN